MNRKLAAWLNLASSFGVHVLTRMPLRRLRRGRDLLRFSEAVTAEGYVPLDPASRIEFPHYMNCVHCGLCAIACDNLYSAPASAWDEAWTFVSGASRSLDRVQLVARDLGDCASAPEAARNCPRGIPINDMAAAIRRLRDASNGA